MVVGGTPSHRNLAPFRGDDTELKILCLQGVGMHSIAYYEWVCVYEKAVCVSQS